MKKRTLVLVLNQINQKKKNGIDRFHSSENVSKQNLKKI